MNRPWTFEDVLAQLGHEPDLRVWLAGQGIEIDQHKTPSALAGAVRELADPQLREQLVAQLQRAARLGDDTGARYMYEAAAPRRDVFMGLVACRGHLHRSVWLYLKHRDVFDQACMAEYADAHGYHAHRFAIPSRCAPSLASAAMDRFCEDLSAYYGRWYHRSGRCVAQMIAREPGVWLLWAHLSDLPGLELDFDVPAHRRYGSPRLHVLLEYAQATGAVRTVLRGDVRLHLHLIRTFAKRLLQLDIETEDIVQQSLDLRPLAYCPSLLQPFAEGASGLRVESLTLRSAGERRDRVVLNDPQPSGAARWRSLFGGDLFRMGWSVESAVLALEFPGDRNACPTRSVRVELACTGQVGLHRLDVRLQAALERCLVTLGVLKPGQALQALDRVSKPAPALEAVQAR